MAAILILKTAGQEEASMIGPFADADAACRFGIKAFPKNKDAQGRDVSWNWQDLIDPKSPYAEHISQANKPAKFYLRWADGYARFDQLGNFVEFEKKRDLATSFPSKEAAEHVKVFNEMKRGVAIVQVSA